MSNDSRLNQGTITINVTVDSIDIQGQYVTLAAPVQLTGELKVAELLAEMRDCSLQDYSSQDLDPILLRIGVDEAGRGPLLGSVNVAAALLPSKWSGLIEDKPLQGTPLSILTDSKQLSEKKRNILYPLVQQYALGCIIAEVPAAVIDQLNILQATMLGMRLCSEQLLIAINDQLVINKANTANHIQAEILYDGNRCPELDYDKLTKVGIDQADIDCQAWVKGDACHTSIAAASILAKVSRDHRMYQLDAQYPQYDIGKHKGYPTRTHMQAIEDYGVLAEHRRSFGPVAKKLAENKTITVKTIKVNKAVNGRQTIN